MSDLIPAGDRRWLKFQSEYTTNEHLMTLYDGIKAHAAIDARGWDMMDERLGGIDRGISDLSFATEQGFAILADQMGSLEQAVTDGFRGMQETFTWGIARICWEHEQDRQIYRDILAAMLRKHQTDSLAYRQDGEKATQNAWWDEAVTDLSKATELYRYDYLAHLQLARVLWFQKHQWEPALEHFELAAKYADTVDADDDQRYYAAVAYCHASLLWRLDAETNIENGAATMEKALSASARAYTLAGTLAVALQEHVLNLLRSAEAGTARRVMDEAVTRDDKLLVFLETSPDLADFDVVRRFVEDWRASRSTAVRDAVRIAEDAERLLTEYSLDATGSRQANLLLSRHAAGPGSTPMTALGEAMAFVQADLTSGEEALSMEILRVRAFAVDAAHTACGYRIEYPSWLRVLNGRDGGMGLSELEKDMTLRENEAARYLQKAITQAQWDMGNCTTRLNERMPWTCIFSPSRQNEHARARQRAERECRAAEDRLRDLEQQQPQREADVARAGERLAAFNVRAAGLERRIRDSGQPDEGVDGRLQ